MGWLRHSAMHTTARRDFCIILCKEKSLQQQPKQLQRAPGEGFNYFTREHSHRIGFFC